MKSSYHLPARYLKCVMISLATLVFISCEHRELCYDHTHWLDLRLEFDWTKEPDATPRTMVVYLFPKDGGEPQRYEMATIKGSIVRAPAGEYDAIAFNGETERLVERGTGFDNFVLTTMDEPLLAPLGRNQSNAPRPDGTEDEPVRSAAETVWSDKIEGVVIAPLVDGQKIRFTPIESTVTYKIKLVNTVNNSRSLELSAALSTMSESYNIGHQSPVGQNVTVPFQLLPSGPDSFEGEITLFGHCPDGNKKMHYLTVYTSNKYYYNYDVTSQIHDAPDPHRITIVIDGLKLPESSGTGMNPSVSDWTDIVDENINMN